jgi:Na+/H+ antiporter NhaD/arsenite permease-like protein
MRGPRAVRCGTSGTWLRRPALLLAAFALSLALGGPVLAASGHPPGGGGEGAHLGERLPLWSALPFAGILLSIALFPLFRPHFWHDHYPKVSFAWAAFFAIPFLAAFRGDALHEILHIYIVDYVPFLILLWALFTVSGGICVTGSIRGTPGANAAVLLVGTILASWVGTTGASMILIRPLLRMNRGRRHRAHVVVFFIFLVANVGGALTPLGDPPLFLGFLHGVPFFWTLRLIPVTAFVAGLLLVLFLVLDTIRFRGDAAFRAARAEEGPRGIRIEGLVNLLFLAGVVGAVLLSGVWRPGEADVLGVGVPYQNAARDALLLAMGLLSLRFTPGRIRERNEFGWAPMKEVACLFAGIFMTIVPALAILRAGSAGALASLVDGVESPARFFWAAGGLSSFLDNAPTYLSFLNTALGRFYPGVPEAEAIRRLIAENPHILEAISAGAVFMGANTYIGNAPNFMVRSIAEEAGVEMPSFFGYVFRYSLPVLVSCFLIVTWLFFG